jgi:hypothetical protein
MRKSRLPSIARSATEGNLNQSCDCQQVLPKATT